MKQLRGLYAQTFFTFRTILVQYVTQLRAVCLERYAGKPLQTDRTYTHHMLCCRITTLTFTFLTNFKISDFNKEYTSSLKMI